MAEDKSKEKKDPIVDSSAAKPFFISSVALALTVGWAIVDETWIRRPYKAIQSRFVDAAEKKGRAELVAAEAELEQQKSSEDYQRAKAALDAAQAAYDAMADERRRLEARLHELTGELNIAREQFAIARGEYQPFVYEYDQARHEGREEAARRAKAAIDAAEPEIRRIFERLDKLSVEQKSIESRLSKMKEPVQEAMKALAAQVPAARRKQEAEQRLSGVASHSVEIVQIYNPALNVVDRCQSCHIAIDKPGYSPEDWEAAKAALEADELAFAKHVFSTHPNFKSGDPARFDAFEKHPPAKFGCTTCHMGNGPATTSPEDAHGLAMNRPGKKWERPISTKGFARPPHEIEGPDTVAWERALEFQITPMLPVHSARFGNMMEATCAKCHTAEVELAGAPKLSMGRQLVEDVGCWGCHKMAGFELKENELEALRGRLQKELIPARERLAGDVERLRAEGEEALAERQRLAQVNQEIARAGRRIEELDREIKFIGPDLNREELGGLRAKIHPRWLPRWIYDPQHFRPGTWMPNSLLDEQQSVEVAAYVWQQAHGAAARPDEAPPAATPETIAEGKRLVEERGCTACHSLAGDGEAEPVPAELRGPTPTRFQVYDLEKWWADPSQGIPEKERGSLLRRGERFGPSLERIGEKVRYPWLVKWILDPRAMQPHTRMPSLRVTPEEAQKMAAYLVTLRKGPPGGEKWKDFDIRQLEDKTLAQRGLQHVIRYGCYNCHAMDLKNPVTGEAIANRGKIGAELSSHGSKPLAQFDFGFFHHTVPHYRPAWLQTKVLEPRIWDTGKYKGDPNERLRMPRYGFTAPEAQAIVTVLAGYTDTKVPKEYMFAPDARQAAIIEGERLVRKFNCRSCHVIDGKGLYGKEALLASLSDALGIARDDPELEKYLPPTLNGQGHRTRPEWLFRFLKNPGSVNPFNPPHGYTLRPWHVLRMPTFEMSDAEAKAFVEYFVALEGEAYPYPEPPAPPSEESIARGRELFKKFACASCHEIGEYAPPERKLTDMGPNFALARERLREDWLWRFIPDPQAFIPGTGMPSPFRARPYAILSEEEKRDVRALADYLIELGHEEFRRKEGWVKGGSGPK